MLLEFLYVYLGGITVLTTKFYLDYSNASRASNTKPMEQALNERGEDCKEDVGAAPETKGRKGASF